MVVRIPCAFVDPKDREAPSASAFYHHGPTGTESNCDASVLVIEGTGLILRFSEFSGEV